MNRVIHMARALSTSKRNVDNDLVLCIDGRISNLQYIHYSLLFKWLINRSAAVIISTLFRRKQQ